MRLFLALIIAIALTSKASAADAVSAIRLPASGSWNGIVGIVDTTPETRAKHNVSTANGGSDATGTMQTTATVTQINAAIAAAPANSYVELAAGSFTLGGDLLLNTDQKTLRGQVGVDGYPSTILNFSSTANHAYIAKSPGSGNYYLGNNSGWTQKTVSSGATRGSTSIVVSSTPTGLSVGQMLFITAPNNPPNIEVGTSEFSQMFSENGAAARPWMQIVKVASISGTTVNFAPAINADYLTTGVQANYLTLAAQINYVGMENLDIRCNNKASNFDDQALNIQGANQCWVRNCKFYGCGGSSFIRSFIHFYACFQCELSHSDFNHGVPASNSSAYALSVWGCSGLLIVNNHITDTPNTMPCFLMSGCAIAYNYVHDMAYGTFLSQWMFAHGCQNHYNLWEGNWVATHYNDGTADGNSTQIHSDLYVRERLSAFDTGKTDNLHAITIRTHSDNITVAACVMGTTSKQTSYNSNGTIGTPHSIFNVDATSDATLHRLGNYNYFNSAIPSAETTALGGNTVAASYLYPSKPSWFGNRPWPWCDPANPTQSNTYTNLPAGFRVANGTDPSPTVNATAVSVSAGTLTVSP